MAGLKEIREGLAENLRAIPDAQVSAYMLPSPTPLQNGSIMVIGPAEVEFDVTGSDGLHHWTMLVQAFAGDALAEGTQMVLDRLIDPDGDLSVKAAIESDPTLGGLAMDLDVVKLSGYQLLRPELLPVNDPRVLLGCTWDVDVYLEGADEA